MTDLTQCIAEAPHFGDVRGSDERDTDAAEEQVDDREAGEQRVGRATHPPVGGDDDHDRQVTDEAEQRDDAVNNWKHELHCQRIRRRIVVVVIVGDIHVQVVVVDVVRARRKLFHSAVNLAETRNSLNAGATSQ